MKLMRCLPAPSMGFLLLVLIGFGCGGGGASAGFSLGGGTTTTYSASGSIVTSDGTPLVAVTVALTGSAKATTTTDAYGNFSFSGLGGGAYTLTPALLDFTFDPTSASFSISNSSATDLRFVATSLSTTTGLIRTYLADLRSRAVIRFLAEDRAIAGSTGATTAPMTADRCLRSELNFENSVQAFLDDSLAFLVSGSHPAPLDKAAVVRLLDAQKADVKTFSRTYYNGAAWEASSPESAARLAATVSSIDTYLDNAYQRVTAQVQALP